MAPSCENPSKARVAHGSSDVLRHVHHILLEQTPMEENSLETTAGSILMITPFISFVVLYAILVS